MSAGNNRSLAIALFNESFNNSLAESEKKKLLAAGFEVDPSFFPCAYNLAFTFIGSDVTKAHSILFNSLKVGFEKIPKDFVEAFVILSISIRDKFALEYLVNSELDFQRSDCVDVISFLLKVKEWNADTGLRLGSQVMAAVLSAPYFWDRTRFFQYLDANKLELEQHKSLVIKACIALNNRQFAISLFYKDELTEYLSDQEVNLFSNTPWHEKLKDKINSLDFNNINMELVKSLPNFCLGEFDNEIFPSKIAEKFVDNFRFGLSKVNSGNNIRKIGFVSSDFCEHSVIFFIFPLLISLVEKDHLEVYIYSNVVKEDEYTQRVKNLGLHYFNVRKLNDIELFNLISKCNLDCLVDLNGWSNGNRGRVFGSGLTVETFTYLGYPSTTRNPGLRYRICDMFTDPPELDRGDWSETLIRTSVPFLTYSPITEESITLRGPLSSVGSGLVYGCIGAPHKLNLYILKLWGEILSESENSSLVVKSKSSGDELFRRYIVEGVSAGGGRSSQVQFDDLLPRGSHLGWFQDIDLILDTFPYSGTTSTMEALWSNCPVLTLIGSTHRSRVSGSILTHLGCQFLVANSREEYKKAALEFRSLVGCSTINDPFRLRHMIINSTLGNAELFLHDLDRSLMEIGLSGFGAK